MRYIEKHYDSSIVMKHEEELSNNQLDESSLTPPNESYPGRSGAELYELVRNMVTFQDLKSQLFEDQGGICCYCGMKLEFPYDPQYRVEHVKPKEYYRALVGEYKNLLLSCKATQEENEARIAAPKRERKKFWHCDEAKGSSELTHTPLDRDCGRYFSYLINGEVRGSDAGAINDIKTLGLNCDYLKRRREAALFALYDADNQILPNDVLYELMVNVMTRKADNGLPEFCFVISNVIEQILP